MIVKNESSCLKTALDSVIGIDEIVICDTGSEDNTIEIAKQYTDKVFTDYKWNDSFCEARNHALSKCTSDWVLIVDADEKLITPIQELKKVIQIAEEKGIKAIDCRVLHHRTKAEHAQPRLFKRCPEVFWKGAIHNYLNTLAGMKSEVVIEYAYSAAHKLDPDRALRILLKEVQKNPNLIREKFYLAREYWYLKDYKTALQWYDEYLKISTWLPERADAYLMKARCLWNLARGEEARHACLMAININANYKEALLFMGDLSWEHNKKQWIKFAELADNSNVLFINNK